MSSILLKTKENPIKQTRIIPHFLKPPSLNFEETTSFFLYALRRPVIKSIAMNIPSVGSRKL